MAASEPPCLVRLELRSVDDPAFVVRSPAGVRHPELRSLGRSGRRRDRGKRPRCLYDVLPGARRCQGGTSHGSPALLLSGVPVIGDVLVFLAGVARMPVGKFIGWTTIGKAARYIAVALAVERF